MRLFLLLVALGTAFAANAAEGIYYGGGIGTTADPVTGTGASVLELHTGYATDAGEGYRTAFELGYSDVSDAALDGGWAAAIFSIPVRPFVTTELRFGVDLGSQSGTLVGLGVGYAVERNSEVRLEVVGREQSVQLLFSMIRFPGVDRYRSVDVQP